MAKTEVGNKIDIDQKRIIYLVIVMTILSSVVILIYLVLLTINNSAELFSLSDRATEAVGGIIAILGAMFGYRKGKKWWEIEYSEKLKAKKEG